MPADLLVPGTPGAKNSVTNVASDMPAWPHPIHSATCGGNLGSNARTWRQ